MLYSPNRRSFITKTATTNFKADEFTDPVGRSLSWYSVLCCAVLCCAVLCCAALRCAALCCAVLCCAALRCAVWCGVVWCGMVCCAAWGGVVWCGVVWCGVVWCGVVWCGVVWCGVVWCGVVWRGVVWRGICCGICTAIICLSSDVFLFTCTELRALATLLGPYGMKYLSERMLQQIASQMGEVKVSVVFQLSTISRPGCYIVYLSCLPPETSKEQQRCPGKFKKQFW